MFNCTDFEAGHKPDTFFGGGGWGANTVINAMMKWYVLLDWLYSTEAIKLQILILTDFGQ